MKKLLSIVVLGLLWCTTSYSNNLNGIYIERNNFSKDMQEKFEKLRADNPSLTVLSEWASEEFKEMVKKTFN